MKPATDLLQLVFLDQFFFLDFFCYDQQKFCKKSQQNHDNPLDNSLFVGNIFVENAAVSGKQL